MSPRIDSIRRCRLSIDRCRSGVGGSIDSASISFSSTAIGSSNSSVSGGMCISLTLVTGQVTQRPIPTRDSPAVGVTDIDRRLTEPGAADLLHFGHQALRRPHADPLTSAVTR